MYNRYIPQGDGSWRRSRMPETAPHRPIPPTPVPEPECCPLPEPEAPEVCQKHTVRPSKPHRPPEQAGNFLKTLLPAGLDTEDLLIVVLLLLMSGDCREDRNLPLLTLALYLFL